MTDFRKPGGAFVLRPSRGVRQRRRQGAAARGHRGGAGGRGVRGAELPPAGAAGAGAQVAATPGALAAGSVHAIIVLAFRFGHG